MNCTTSFSPLQPNSVSLFSFRVQSPLSVDRAVLDDPLLLADLDPVGEVLAVEQLDPLFVGLQGLRGRLRESGDGRAQMIMATQARDDVGNASRRIEYTL